MLINYQLVYGYKKDTGEEVLCSSTVFSADVKKNESFETIRMYGDEPTKLRWVELRRKKDMIIPEGTISEGPIPLQPRRIVQHTDGTYVLWYGWPKGKSWSQSSTCIDIKIVNMK